VRATSSNAFETQRWDRDSQRKRLQQDGKAFDRTYRFTDTWMDRGGNWQCIASQESLVSQK